MHVEFKRASRRSQQHTVKATTPLNGGGPSTGPKQSSGTKVTLIKWSMRLPSKSTVQRVVSRKRFIVIVVITVLVLSGVFAYRHFFAQPSISTNPETKPLDKLEYQTVTPQGKPAQQLGGWRRVSPPEATPVFAYTDTIDGVQISVSQQPLPDKFIESTDSQLNELAKSFNTTNEIAASGVKVYLGTSAQGPQSVMFIKNGLLILIKSQNKIEDKSWANYAESLK